MGLSAVSFASLAGVQLSAASRRAPCAMGPSPDASPNGRALALRGEFEAASVAVAQAIERANAPPGTAFNALPSTRPPRLGTVSVSL
jgi:hypothetical protein